MLVNASIDSIFLFDVGKGFDDVNDGIILIIMVDKQYFLTSSLFGHGSKLKVNKIFESNDLKSCFFVLEP